ncbi:hypothetical protein KY360_00520 [Candidatus Woesearchaeota archaeon]|nr:hypothetical protein [Candidatus Woesearchaeota archaeon]
MNNSKKYLMKKKGMLSLQMVVVAVLALIVLVVLSFVFRDNITRTAKEFFRIGEDAGEAARGTKCVTFLTAGTRKCVDPCPEDWREVYPVGEKWTDCDKKCCEIK